jgi:hypothetical protein
MAHAEHARRLIFAFGIVETSTPARNSEPSQAGSSGLTSKWLQTCLDLVFLSENSAFGIPNSKRHVMRGFRGAGVPPAVFLTSMVIKNASETPAPRKPAHFAV